MIEIDNDLLIFKEEDVKIGCDWRDDVAAFKHPDGIMTVWEKFDNIVYLCDDYFILLKSRIDQENLRLFYRKKYSVDLYKQFLYIMYFMINNNVFLPTATAEMRRHFKL